MNVSRAANHTFLKELKEADPTRFENLMDNIQRDLPWTNEHWSQLTAFMLGKPVKPGFNFMVVAGKLIELVRGTDTRKACDIEGTPEFAAKMQRWRRAAARQAKKTGVLPVGWKLCAHCGEPFEPWRQGIETCSKRCARRFRRRLETSEVRINTGDFAPALGV